MINSSTGIDIFPWNDNFDTGLDEVDRQHRRLVHILNQLASQVAFGLDDFQLSGVFDELIDYTHYHFDTEEAIWNQYLPDSDDEAAHKKVTLISSRSCVVSRTMNRSGITER
ncbi:MAG: hemerythrin domain-containing protein [Candidatus Thiodiazotropha sp.]